jgi:hypothetical protein
MLDCSALLNFVWRDSSKQALKGAPLFFSLPMQLTRNEENEGAIAGNAVEGNNPFPR